MSHNGLNLLTANCNKGIFMENCGRQFIIHVLKKHFLHLLSLSMPVPPSPCNNSQNYERSIPITSGPLPVLETPTGRRAVCCLVTRMTLMKRTWRPSAALLASFQQLTGPTEGKVTKSFSLLKIIKKLYRLLHSFFASLSYPLKKSKK